MKIPSVLRVPRTICLTSHQWQVLLLMVPLSMAVVGSVLLGLPD